jgi:DNA-binding XRE family transcriptional regulator
MSTHQIVNLAGKDFVIIERTAFERLTTLAKTAELPALPRADKSGNFPAVAYAKASLARKIIRERAALGLNQKALADLAGLPVENLCRIERGKLSPRLSTLAKIENALRQARHQAKENRN